MTTEDERRRAVAAIDSQIAALLEDGVPADSSRIRALKARRAVALMSKKAIKRSVRKARVRRATEAAVPAETSSTASRPTSLLSGKIRLAPDTAEDQQRLRSLAEKDRRRVESTRIEVRELLSRCPEPTVDGVKRAIATCDTEVNALINKGVGYDANARELLRSRRKRLKELAQVLASRRRKRPPTELELALLLHERRVRIRRGPENVVGVLDMRSGGAPSLGKRW